MRHSSVAVAITALTLAYAAPVSARPASSFVENAIKRDNAQIVLGSLAQMRGETKAVQELGQTLVNDHTNARLQMIALAKSLHVTVPRDPDRSGQAEYKKLAKMSGTAFDREFVNHTVDAQKKDIAATQSQVKAPDPRVRQIAEKRVPALRKHLALARGLQVRQERSISSR